jgi:hypothetical protein
VEKTDVKPPPKRVKSPPRLVNSPPRSHKTTTTNVKSSPRPLLDQNNTERYVLMTCCFILFNLLVFWFSYDRLANSMDLMHKNHEAQMKMMQDLMLTSEERTRRIEKDLNNLSNTLKNEVKKNNTLTEKEARSKTKPKTSSPSSSSSSVSIE